MPAPLLFLQAMRKPKNPNTNFFYEACYLPPRLRRSVVRLSGLVFWFSGFLIFWSCVPAPLLFLQAMRKPQNQKSRKTNVSHEACFLAPRSRKNVVRLSGFVVWFSGFLVFGRMLAPLLFLQAMRKPKNPNINFSYEACFCYRQGRGSPRRVSQCAPGRN